MTLVWSCHFLSGKENFTQKQVSKIEVKVNAVELRVVTCLSRVPKFLTENFPGRAATWHAKLHA